MITLFAKPASTAYCAVLPWIAGWVIKTVRPSVGEISLGGTVIRQSAAKEQSTGTVSYNGMVPTAQADQVKLIDAASSTCYLTDPTGVYEAEIDAVVSPSEKNGKKLVTATFKIVRRVHAA